MWGRYSTASSPTPGTGSSPARQTGRKSGGFGYSIIGGNPVTLSKFFFALFSRVLETARGILRSSRQPHIARRSLLCRIERKTSIERAIARKQLKLQTYQSRPNRSPSRQFPSLWWVRSARGKARRQRRSKRARSSNLSNNNTKTDTIEVAALRKRITIVTLFRNGTHLSISTMT
jgi:hypothetical protein